MTLQQCALYLVAIAVALGCDTSPASGPRRPSPRDSTEWAAAVERARAGRSAAREAWLQQQRQPRRLPETAPVLWGRLIAVDTLRSILLVAAEPATAPPMLVEVTLVPLWKALRPTPGDSLLGQPMATTELRAGQRVRVWGALRTFHGTDPIRLHASDVLVEDGAAAPAWPAPERRSRWPGHRAT